MTTRDKALGPFKGPFRYDVRSGYIYDADDHAVADLMKVSAAGVVGPFIAEAMTEKFNKEKENNK